MTFQDQDIEIAEALHKEAGEPAVHNDGDGAEKDIDVVVDRTMEQRPDNFTGQRATALTYVTVLLSQIVPKRGDTITLEDGAMLTVASPISEDRVSRKYVVHE